MSNHISRAVEELESTGVEAWVNDDPAPQIIGPHQFPWTDPEAKRLGITPSQHSALVRAAFTRLLPDGLDADAMHAAWHRYLLDHRTIWPACHGALGNRVQEAQFFAGAAERVE